MKRIQQAAVVVTALAFILMTGQALAADKPTQPAAQSGMQHQLSAGKAQMKGWDAAAKNMCNLHGGIASMSAHHQFETVFMPDGLRVYEYNEKGEPVMVDKSSGVATLKFANGRSEEIALTAHAPEAGETAVYFCPMHPDQIQMMPGRCKVCNMALQAQDYLYGKADLSKVKPDAMTASIKVTGLPGDETDVTYSQGFQPVMQAQMQGMHGMMQPPTEGQKGMGVVPAKEPPKRKAEGTGSH